MPMKFIQVVLGFLLLICACLVQAAKEANLQVQVAFVTRAADPIIPLSLLDLPIENEGLLGAQLGLRDTQTTGRFLGQEYSLDELQLSAEKDMKSLASEPDFSNYTLFIADLETEDLLALSEAAPNALIFNSRAQDDSLRNEQCRANVFHVAPSRAMLTDGLAQFLAWKRWSKIVLVTGRHPNDEAYSTAMRRAAKRFGLKVVDDKQWTSKPGARRTDSGHHSLQSEVPAFSQFNDYDVLVVADEKDEFGEYLSYQTTRPRPVAGTQGLIATAWHRSQEQWGATQIQRRFEKLSGRWMSSRDYAAWAAMRTIGEAVTNTSTIDPTVLREYILSDALKLAAFKGVALNYRAWNGQLRQPVLLAGPRMLVSVSPQSGFLHEFSELDTLGYDAPESACQHF